MKNSCEKYRDLFFLGVGNDLTEELQSDLDKHLAECADCKLEYDKISKMNSVFDVLRSDLSKIEKSTDLSAIRSRNIAKLKLKLNKTNRIRLITRMLNPIAAALLILVVSVSLILFPNSPKKIHNNTSLSTTENPPKSVTNPIAPTAEPIPPYGVGTISSIPEKKNEFNDEISELKMKFLNTHQGHYTQGSYVRDRKSISYTSTTNRVETGMSDDPERKPVGFKPTQTKIESSLDENNPDNFGF